MAPSQSDLLNQYVLENKKIQQNLTKTGEKRSYSLGLVNSCDCHATTSTINIEKSPNIKILIQNAAPNWIKKSCITCQSQKSPFWWPMPTIFDADGVESKPAYECQQCKWKNNSNSIIR